MSEENNLHSQVVLLQKEITELKKMVQVLGQVAWITSDDATTSVIDYEDWDLLYMEGKK